MACPSFDQHKLFYWAGMRQAVCVNPSEASFALKEVGVVGVTFP